MRCLFACAPFLLCLIIAVDVPCVSAIQSRFLTLPIVATCIAILACGMPLRTMLAFHVVSVVKLSRRVDDILTQITNKPARESSFFSCVV